MIPTKDTLSDFTRCARCHSDTLPSRREKDSGPAIYAKSGSKDPTEFHRLYDRLGELREKIDGFLKEARFETERNAGPRVIGSRVEP